MTEKTASELEALIVVDMQKDNVGRFCQDIIPNIKLLIDEARKKGIRVIFACDSRYPDDFLFTRNKLRPHDIRGTEGAKVIQDLDPRPADIIVEKRMLSAFFGSDLDFTLRQKDITTLIVTGVDTAGCVLKTVLDAMEIGYEVIVPADCCSSMSREHHECALKIFARFNLLKGTAAEVARTL